MCRARSVSYVGVRSKSVCGSVEDGCMWECGVSVDELSISAEFSYTMPLGGAR